MHLLNPVDREFAARAPAGCRAAPTRRAAARRQSVRAAAADEDVGTAGIAAIGLGLLANPICLWSEYTLKTTGSGLPPGPGAEHPCSVAAPASALCRCCCYFARVAVLPTQPPCSVLAAVAMHCHTAGGALGAAEGVSYLVILGVVGWSAYT